MHLLGFTAKRLNVCRTLGPTACSKMLSDKHVWKRCRKEKKSMIVPRQPWTCSHLIYTRNAYRSLPGNQDVFSVLISSICIHRNPGEWLITFMYSSETLWTLFYSLGFTAQRLKLKVLIHTHSQVHMTPNTSLQMCDLPICTVDVFNHEF